jgi:hypothetical protein
VVGASKSSTASSKGVFLRGQLDKATATNVLAAQRGLVARAAATGRLWVEISKDNWIPDQPKKAAAAPKKAAAAEGR